MIKIDVEERENIVIVCISGNLSLGDIDEFDHTFKKYNNSNLDVIALDLKYIPHLDSFGLNRIIKVSRDFGGSGTEFVLINMNEDIHKTFTTTTFDKLFQIMTQDEFDRKYFPVID